MRFFFCCLDALNRIDRHCNTCTMVLSANRAPTLRCRVKCNVIVKDKIKRYRKHSNA